MAEETAEALAAQIFIFAQKATAHPGYAGNNLGEAGSAVAAVVLLLIVKPELRNIDKRDAALKIQRLAAKHLFGGQNVVGSTNGMSESKALANMGPDARRLYDQLQKNDPKQARAFLIQEMMSSLKMMGEILSNVSKTRSEISMTFARNARA